VGGEGGGGDGSSEFGSDSSAVIAFFHEEDEGFEHGGVELGSHLFLHDAQGLEG
jgi:hypothetical protein